MKTKSLKFALVVAIALFALSVLALFAPVALASQTQTVVLTSDVEQAYTVADGANVTIDLAGYTMKAGVTVKGAGSVLTITDSSDALTGTVAGKYAISALDGGKVVIEQANVTATTYAIYVNDGQVIMNGGVASSQLGYGVVLFGSDQVGANFTLNNGTIQGTVGLTSMSDDSFDNTNVTINGGTIEASNDQIALYWASTGLLKVTGGNITGGTAVYVKSGSVQLLGGNYVATGVAYQYKYTANGAVSTGDAVVIENVVLDSYQGITSATVENCNLTSANGKAIASYAYVAGDEVANFVGEGVVANTSIPANLVADGYQATLGEDGKYVVDDKPVAQVGDEIFGKVEWAFNSAIQSGKTLVMLANYDAADYTFVVPADKTFTIDLNGFVLSGSSSQRNHQLFINNGTMVVNDTSANANGEIRYTFTGARDASMGTGNYTISNRGILTLNNGTINNATEASATRHMLDAVDNNTTLRDATFTVNGGEVKCEAYMAIRQFANSTSFSNNLVINDGKVGKVYVQNPINNNAAKATFQVTGGQVVGYYVYFATNSDNLVLDLDTNCILPGYAFLYVADSHYTYTDTNGKLICLTNEQVARVGNEYYSLADAVAKASETNQEVVLIKDATLASDFAINTNVVIDLNQQTLTLTGYALKITANVTFQNGTIDITGAVAKQIHLIYVGVISTPGTLNLDQVEVVGNGYTTDYSVFFIGNKGTLNINDSTVTLAGDNSTRGGVFKADAGTSEATLNITDSAISFKDADIGFLNANVTITNSTLTIEGGKNAINGSVLTLVNSEVEIFGSNERGITVTNGDVTIIDSVVDIHDMAEASIRFKENHVFEVKGSSQVSVETIIIDSATGAIFEELVVVEEARNFTQFEITVDQMVYTNALVGLANIQDNSVVVLHIDLELPMAITINKNITFVGNNNEITGAGANTVVVDGATVALQGFAVQNSVGNALTLKNGAIVTVDAQSSILGEINAGAVANLQETTYAADLAAMLAYLPADYSQVEITLLADQTLQDVAINVAKASALTIKLNNFDINTTNTVAGQFAIVNNGHLTIIGNGEINYAYVGAQDASYGKGNGVISNRGTLYVKDVTLVNNTAKMSHSLNVLDNNSTTANASATLENAQLYCTNVGITVRQYANSEVYENNVVVKGESVIAGPAAMQIMLPSNNSQSRKASLTIQDDVVVRTTNQGGYAFYTYSAGNSLADVTINISGGEFYGWVIVGYSTSPVTVTETLNVTGGTFVDYMIYSYADPAVVTTNNYNVTGGNYAYEPSEICVPNGFVIAANSDNTYSVVSDLQYVEDYVSEDAKATLKAYMDDMIANGYYSQVGVANLNAMYLNACSKLDLATTIAQTETIVEEAKIEFTYVVNKWEEAALQAQAVVSLKQYAASKGVAEDQIPATAYELIANSATVYNVNVALANAMAQIDQVVEEMLQAAFQEQIDLAVAEVNAYAQAIGVTVDTTVIQAATNQAQLANAVAQAKLAVDAAFDLYQQNAVDSLYGTNNENAAHVTTAMVASIYAAETVEEVDVAVQVVATEIAQIKEYKNKIASTYDNLQSVTDAANQAVQAANNAATKATEVATKAEALGLSVQEVLTAAQQATLAAQQAQATAELAKTAAEAAKLAAESGKATAEQLATAVANAQTAAQQAETAAKAAEAAAKLAAEKAQTAEVKVYAETATAELQTWISQYINSLSSKVVASNSAVSSDFRTELQSKIADKYTEANQALIMSYYDQAISAIKLATTTDEVDYALQTFKANVALVDVLQSVGGNTPAQVEDSKVTTWLMAVAAVEALLAIAVLCLLFKKKTTVTVELPMEELVSQAQEEQPAQAVVEQVAEEVVEEEVVEEQPIQEPVAIVDDGEDEEVYDDADQDDADDGEETEEVAVAEGEVDQFASLQNRKSKTFDERLAEADDETRALYQQIRASFLCYSKVKERKSKKFASFRRGRTLYAKVVLRGKSFNVFLALNPDEYVETVYHHKNKGDKKAYELVPMMVRVRSPRSLKKLQRLIEEMFPGEEKIEFIPETVVAVVAEETAPAVEETAVVEDVDNVEDEVDTDEDDTDDEETEEVAVVEGEDPFASLQNRKSKTFDERLAEADDETRALYEQIRASLLCYKKVKERKSKKFVSFRRGRNLLVKAVLRGKSFNVFLALNPDDYAETVYHHKNKGDKKAYELVPMMVRVRSPRSLKKLQRLIDEMFPGEEKVAYVPEVAPVEEVVAPAVEEAVAVQAEVAAPVEVDQFASLQNRKSKTFDERLAEADEETRATYEEIKAEFLSFSKVKERQSKKFVSFRKGRNLLAKVVLRGKSFNVFLALNPDEYAETVYHHKAKGDKKAYELVPMMVRVRSPRSVKKVKRLIADVVAKADQPQA